jgi:hypothetical protein
MGYKTKTGNYKGKTQQEYQREYYLKNRDKILLRRAESYRNKLKERNKNKNNVHKAPNKLEYPY